MVARSDGSLRELVQKLTDHRTSIIAQWTTSQTAGNTPDAVGTASVNSALQLTKTMELTEQLFTEVVNKFTVLDSNIIAAIVKRQS